MLCCREARLALLRSTIGRYVQTRTKNQSSIFKSSIRQRTRSLSSAQAAVASPSPISSVTSIDAVRSLPRGRQELHDALTTLKVRGSSYVNLSQIELALRGLESDKTVIRIAILGVNGVASAAKLLRAILVDPLKPEEPWESDLTDKAARDGRGMLVRYGESYNYDARNHLLQTLSIPAAHLYQNEVEYVVLNFTPGGPETPRDEEVNNLLTPMVGIPNSASGRVSMIRNPVHKALVYAEGIQGLLTLARSLRTGEEGPIPNAIGSAVNNDWSTEALHAIPGILSMRLGYAETAIATLRQSVQNSTKYEQSWLDSGISTVTTWLEAGVHPGPQPLKPALENLIDIVLKSAEQKLAMEASHDLVESQANQVSYATRQKLQTAVTSWAEFSHNDLQYSLEAAFQGKYWTGLAWWKLPWHIDDVEIFLTHLVKNSWLVEPEKGMIYLGGRMNQAGIDVLALNSTAEELRAKLLQYEPISASKPAAFPKLTEDAAQPASHPPPPRPYQTSQWTQTISFARALAVHTHFAPLQATGQRLLWQAYSLTALTSTLASLIYISASSTTIYEAGAVAAFGLAYGARRLQTRWERERTKLKWALRQTGRSQIRRFEEEARRAIERGTVDGEDSVGAQDREEARMAVDKVRKALGEVRNVDGPAEE